MPLRPEQAPHVLNDPLDPVLKDVGQSADAAREHIVRRRTRWVSCHSSSPHLFCQHGSYVGFERSLAYYCPLCPED